MKTDFLGNELQLDDEVVFIQLGYRNLLNGKIIKMTDKTCLIEHEPTNIGNTTSKQFYTQVLKIK